MQAALDISNIRPLKVKLKGTSDPEVGIFGVLTVVSVKIMVWFSLMTPYGLIDSILSEK